MVTPMSHVRAAFAIAAVWFSVSVYSAVAWQPPAAQEIRANYAKSEHMVPMRDGVKLFTIVYAPKDNSTPNPFMLHRTPYGSPPYGPDAYRSSLGPSTAFAAEKFIFVYQDVRGKFRSEGEFVVMRPLVPHTQAAAGDRREHGYLRHDRVAREERARTTTGASDSGGFRIRARRPCGA